MISRDDNKEVRYSPQRQPQKSFIGIFSITLLVVGILVTISISLLEHKKKELSYEIIGKSELVSVHLPDEDVEITYSGKKVNHLELISIRFVNTGNIPIRREDFERPLELTLSKDSDVFVVRTGPTLPENLHPEVSVISSLVQISPLLLNPGDSFVVEIITSAKESMPQISTRIAGIQKLQFLKRGAPEMQGIPAFLRIVALVIAFTLYTFLLGISLPFRGSPQMRITKIEAILAAMLASFVAVLLFLDHTKMTLFPKVSDILLAITPIIIISIYLTVRRRILKEGRKQNQ